MNDTLSNILKTINEYGYVRIVPKIDLDSLIASSILFENLNEHRIRTSINYDPKVILEQNDEPTLLINLPKITERPNLFTINFNERESVSAYISYFLDKIYGVSTYDKILSIATGIYQGLDTVEGFKGIESELLKELTSKEIIEYEPGFRFWGRTRLDLARSIYRTLIPFIPGFTGDPEKINELLSRIIGGKTDIIKHVHIEQNKELAARFLEYLLNNLSTIMDVADAKKIIRKILGNIYIVRINNRLLLELNETVGMLNIYLSLQRSNPQYISIISIDPNILSELIAICDNIIDELIIDVSIAINQFIKTKQNVFELEEVIERPEIFIEILKNMEMLPEKKPVIIRYNGEYYTSLGELLRIGNDAETLYAYCDEFQLCMVDQDGNIIKA